MSSTDPPSGTSSTARMRSYSRRVSVPKSTCPIGRLSDSRSTTKSYTAAHGWPRAQFALTPDTRVQHTNEVLHLPRHRLLGSTMETRAPLNILDELYLHLNRDDEPYSVHLEIKVDGRIDARRLTDAVHDAAALHPVARARLAQSRGTDVRYHWEIADDLENVPLEVVDCPDDGALECERRRALGTAPDLSSAPPFTLTLAHMDAGDSLILNLHHAAGDGIGAVRLLGSILRAYAGEEDPIPEVDPIEARD